MAPNLYLINIDSINKLITKTIHCILSFQFHHFKWSMFMQYIDALTTFSHSGKINWRTTFHKIYNGYNYCLCYGCVLTCCHITIYNTADTTKVLFRDISSDQQPILDACLQNVSLFLIDLLNSKIICISYFQFIFEYMYYIILCKIIIVSLYVSG